ncbi:MAG: GNAT family N-acetyltransferase [Lachnospiraceae bacterium]|nr:GNAT family N-acetyltransferase [Lachnospiraceae bacterium]
MIEISSITSDDLPQITRYYETYLNSGETVRAAIRNAFEKGICYGCKAVSDGEVAGYFTFQDGISLTCPQPDAQKQIAKLAAGMNVVTVDALMVGKEYRGCGIAGQMAKWNKEMLLRRGIEAFLVEIWVYPDGSSPARAIYEKMGQSLWRRQIPMFYKDAHRYGISCPICGSRCVCGAVLEIIRVTA